MTYQDCITTIYGKTQGHIIIREFPDVLTFMATTPSTFQEIRGVSSVVRHKAEAVLELSRLYHGSIADRDITKVKCPEDVASLMIPLLKDETRENFWSILLNTKNGILRKDLVAIGSLNAALVHPREIFKLACIYSAAGLIIVHNHPTGNPEPSREDTDLTIRFAKCGELMGIDLVDHIIIGGDGFISMRERGLVTT